MKKLFSVSTLFFSFCTALLVGAEASAQATYTFTQIDVPGASFTQEASGINNAGQIVGLFFRNATGPHGFVRDTGGMFTPLDVPGASFTQASGINNAGQIVGLFGNATGDHGFVYTGGVFTPLDVPGASFTQASGINNAGQIVGNFSRNATGPHGFVRDTGGMFTPLDVPGASLTQALGINDAGEIVGNFSNTIESGFHGFVYAGGVFTTLDVLGASGINDAGQIVDVFVLGVSGINDAGQIVGVVLDNASGAHGFVDTGGVFTLLDVPGANSNSTFVTGINDAGQIVGGFEDATGKHGFFATPTAEPSALTLNQTTFHTGDQLILNAQTTPGPSPVQADVYVALQLPGCNSLACALFWQGGLNFTATPQPILRNWPVSPFNGTIFSHTFGGTEPVGSYVWLGAFAVPGTLNLMGGITHTPFSFSP